MNNNPWEYFDFNGAQYRRKLNEYEFTVEWQKFRRQFLCEYITKEWFFISLDEKEEIENVYQKFIFEENRIKKLERIIND